MTSLIHGGVGEFFYADGPRGVHQIYQQLATVHNGNKIVCSCSKKN